MFARSIRLFVFASFSLSLIGCGQLFKGSSSDTQAATASPTPTPKTDVSGRFIAKAAISGKITKIESISSDPPECIISVETDTGKNDKTTYKLLVSIDPLAKATGLNTRFSGNYKFPDSFVEGSVLTALYQPCEEVAGVCPAGKGIQCVATELHDQMNYVPGVTPTPTPVPAGTPPLVGAWKSNANAAITLTFNGGNALGTGTQTVTGANNAVTTCTFDCAIDAASKVLTLTFKTPFNAACLSNTATPVAFDTEMNIHPALGTIMWSMTRNAGAATASTLVYTKQ